MKLPSNQLFTWAQLTQHFSNSLTEEEAISAVKIYEGTITYDRAVEIMASALDGVEKADIEDWNLLDRLTWITRHAYITGAMEATATMTKANIMGFLELLDQDASPAIVDAILSGKITL